MKTKDFKNDSITRAKTQDVKRIELIAYSKEEITLGFQHGEERNMRLSLSKDEALGLKKELDQFLEDKWGE